MDPAQRDAKCRGDTRHAEEERDAAQMSAAAVSFYVDKEAHNTFLRVSTNQELQATNEKLTILLQEKTQECGYWYTEAHSHGRKLEAVQESLETVEESLEVVTKDRDYYKKCNVWLDGNGWLQFKKSMTLRSASREQYRRHCAPICLTQKTKKVRRSRKLQMWQRRSVTMVSPQWTPFEPLVSPR